MHRVQHNTLERQSGPSDVVFKPGGKSVSDGTHAQFKQQLLEKEGLALFLMGGQRNGVRGQGAPTPSAHGVQPQTGTVLRDTFAVGCTFPWRSVGPKSECDSEFRGVRYPFCVRHASPLCSMAPSCAPHTVPGARGFGPPLPGVLCSVPGLRTVPTLLPGPSSLFCEDVQLLDSRLNFSGGVLLTSPLASRSIDLPACSGHHASAPYIWHHTFPCDLAATIHNAPRVSFVEARLRRSYHTPCLGGLCLCHYGLHLGETFSCFHEGGHDTIFG